MEHTSSEKILEALKLLEEAAAQKKDELKSIMSNKYVHLKNVIVETEHSLAKSVSAAGKYAVEEAVHAKDAGVKKTRELVRDVDKSVHRSPWSYIAGSVGVSLLLGYILGQNRK